MPIFVASMLAYRMQSPPVVGKLFVDNLPRALVIAVVVGTVLLLVNHGDHIELEPVCPYFWSKCALCYLVPFAVSMISAMLAARTRELSASRRSPRSRDRRACRRRG